MQFFEMLYFLISYAHWQGSETLLGEIKASFPRADLWWLLVFIISEYPLAGEGWEREW